MICLSSAGSLVGRQVTSSCVTQQQRQSRRLALARRTASFDACVRATRGSRDRASQPGGRAGARAAGPSKPPAAWEGDLWWDSTLTPACSRPNPRAPCAFEESMVHVGLQFTTHIAFRGVLHRPGSLAIHRRKFVTFPNAKAFCTKQQNERKAMNECKNPNSNDPSAGSPTETLLRLLHHLDDRVQPVSRQARRLATPLVSPGRPICRSDGRCVQRAGT